MDYLSALIFSINQVLYDLNINLFSIKLSILLYREEYLHFIRKEVQNSQLESSNRECKSQNFMSHFIFYLQSSSMFLTTLSHLFLEKNMFSKIFQQLRYLIGMIHCTFVVYFFYECLLKGFIHMCLITMTLFHVQVLVDLSLVNGTAQPCQEFLIQVCRLLM